MAFREGNKGFLELAITRVVISALIVGAGFFLVFHTLTNQYLADGDALVKNQLKQMVTVSMNTIEPVVGAFSAGEITQSEAVEQIQDILRRMTYKDRAGDNYVFMVDMEGHILVQPYRKEMENKDYWFLQDEFGTYIIQEIIIAAKKHPRGSYVSYYYYPPFSETAEEKLSYVVLIPELEVCVGTGTYMGELKTVQRKFKFQTLFLAIIMFILLLVPITISFRELEKRNLALADEIKERIQTSKALTESERQLELALNGAELGLWDLNPAARRLVVKADWLESTERRIGLFEGAYVDWLSRIHPEDRDVVETIMESYLSGRTDLNEAEYRIVTAAGVERWILDRGKVVEKDNNGIPTRAAGTLLDLTDRKKMETALIRSEERYRLLIENTKEGFFILTGLEDEFTFVNQTFCDIFGYSEKDAAALRINDLIGPDDVSLIAEDLETAGQHPKPDVFQQPVPAYRKGGAVILIELSIITLQRQTKRSYQGLVRNVTEREKLVRQLQHAQRMEAVGTLSSGIAHDFNNLLQAINGVVHILKDSMRASDEDRELLSELDGVLLKGGELVKGLLTFGRKVEPKFDVVNLNEMVEQAVMLLERTIPKMISIEKDLSDDLHPVKCDPGQIQQILLNLGANAKDAMPNGGVLSFSTLNAAVDAGAEDGNPDLKSGKYVVLKVTDTGSGIDEKISEQIFDPFFTTKGPGAGSGLGLAMAYGIIKNHGGEIAFKSSPDEGTEFSIYLPAREDHSEAGRKMEEKSDTVVSRGYETILLVDDEMPIIKAGKFILEKQGYTVLSAFTGEEALSIYKDNKDDISLVVMDLGMPGMGGWACLKEMKAFDPDVRVMIASGYTDMAQKEELFRDGVLEFINKPYRVKDLLDVVRKILDSK